MTPDQIQIMVLTYAIFIGAFSIFVLATCYGFELAKNRGREH